MITLHRILVPTDFSEHSKNALRYGAAFAEKFRPTIEAEGSSPRGIAQPRRALHDRIEHRLHVSRRLTDHAENLGGRWHPAHLFAVRRHCPAWAVQRPPWPSVRQGHS